MILTAALSCFMQEGPLPCFRRNKRSRAAVSDGSGPAVQVGCELNGEAPALGHYFAYRR